MPEGKILFRIPALYIYQLWEKERERALGLKKRFQLASPRAAGKCAELGSHLQEEINSWANGMLLVYSMRSGSMFWNNKFIDIIKWIWLLNVCDMYLGRSPWNYTCILDDICIICLLHNHACHAAISSILVQVHMFKLFTCHFLCDW